MIEISRCRSLKRPSIDLRQISTARTIQLRGRYRVQFPGALSRYFLGLKYRHTKEGRLDVIAKHCDACHVCIRSCVSTTGIFRCVALEQNLLGPR